MTPPEVPDPPSRPSANPGGDVPPHWTRGSAEVWLPTAEEIAALDRRAVESGATTERALIEAAGREVARRVQGRWPSGRVVGLLGSGHNGADTMVALRTLAAWGRDVEGVVCGSSPPEPDVSAGWDVPLRDREGIDEALEGAAVVLDGILGTGVAGAPREPQAEVIRRANGCGAPVVAVDGPSGVDFTTGAVPGACIRARLTVSLGWPKLGLLRYPGRTRCGEIEAVEIGFPPVEETEMGARAVTARWVREMLRSRRSDAHKGDAGYLAVVSGQEGMAGASVLGARAATRGGAGIVRVVGDPANRTIVQSSVPDAVFDPWDDEAAVRDAVEWSDALVVGPGLGRGEDRRRLVERLLEAREARPLLLDADGLNVWAGEMPALAARLGAGDVVTPHPGELGRLLELSVPEVLEDPPARAREAADRLGACVLLKGSPSLVARPDGRLRVAATGGAEVASGGSGDVLAGLAGAYLAAGLGAADAASAALLVSGLAARRSRVPEGHLASDVPDRIPGVREAVEGLGAHSDGAVVFALPPVG